MCIRDSAWLADSIWEFRRRLLVGYRQQAIDHQVQTSPSVQPAASPFTSPADLHNDDPRLFVRPHRDLPGTGAELVVGGRMIPDARHATEQEPLSADAEIASHRLMVKAGLINQTVSGIYSYLPLAWRSVRKIENIIREQMDAAGAQELRLPALQPQDIWDLSGRNQIFGDDMFRLSDRRDRPLVFAPTH